MLVKIASRTFYDPKAEAPPVAEKSKQKPLAKPPCEGRWRGAAVAERVINELPSHIFHRPANPALGCAEERNGGKANLETPGQNVPRTANAPARHGETPRHRAKALLS